MIPFIDLQAQQRKIRTNLDTAIKRILDHGKYIMGPEIDELEDTLAAFCGAKYAISCSSGTDALLMALMAKDIGPGDAVILPSFTFPATPEVVALLGATPIFADVEKATFNISPSSVKQAIAIAKAQGLTPKVIVAVDLYGQPANYPELEKIAVENELWILADAAQSFGAQLKEKKVGTLALMTATSFFPAKPLGCYGDGGAVFTDDDELADKLRSIRVHGKGAHKYDNVRIGLNARLDTIQAAILLEKLKIFPDELLHREHVASKYSKELQEYVLTPTVLDGVRSAWAQYTLVLPEGVDRSSLSAKLTDAGVPTMVYYEKPLHCQIAYKACPVASESGLPISEELSEKVLSLPMSGYVTDEQISHIVNEVKKWI